MNRTLTAIALGATLAATSAGVASAATISAPVVLKPGAEIPVDFAGYEEPVDGKLPAGYRIVKRKVVMQEGEVHLDGKRSVVLTLEAGGEDDGSSRTTLYALAKKR